MHNLFDNQQNIGHNCIVVNKGQESKDRKVAGSSRSAVFVSARSCPDIWAIKSSEDVVIVENQICHYLLVKFFKKEVVK